MSSSLIYITVHVPACYEAGKAVDYPSSQSTRDFSAFPFFNPIVSEPFSNPLETSYRSAIHPFGNILGDGSNASIDSTSRD